MDSRAVSVRRFFGCHAACVSNSCMVRPFFCDSSGEALQSILRECIRMHNLCLHVVHLISSLTLFSAPKPHRGRTGNLELACSISQLVNLLPLLITELAGVYKLPIEHHLRLLIILDRDYSLKGYQP